MSKIKILNLNHRPRQFLFKNKLTLKKKSKNKLLRECLFMFISAFFLFFINHLIPQKGILIYSFIDNVQKIYFIFINFLKYFFQITLVFLIFFITIMGILLIIGGLYRLLKIIRRDTKKNPNFK